ncbi:MAG TPA: 3-oxoacyl-ACP reductase family protein [Nitrososphaerales archaeon]|nr:3-oxoacyl-ACP reductase family protein [Nitrososphaerales archaeon]
MDKRLDGKVAIVTGAARGIGRAIAEVFAREGASVVVGYNTSKKDAARVVNGIRRRGGKAISVKVDVSDPSEVSGMVSKVLDQYGTIDVLVNNAGVLIPGEFLKTKSSDWDRVIDTNMKGAFLCSQAVAPLMLKKGGRIINIASISGLAQPSGMASVSYVASKAGLIGLTRAMALHLGPKVNVNAVAPGTVETEMTKFLTKSEVQGMVDESFAKRLGKPEEVAYACVFLASEEASWITGEILTVSGGRGMR